MTGWWGMVVIILECRVRWGGEGAGQGAGQGSIVWNIYSPDLVTSLLPPTPLEAIVHTATYTLQYI